MDITEVRIKLMDEPGERLKAFCSITFDDCFVVRDLKIIEGSSGPFVAMPSRKLTSHCPRCSMKNHLRAAYCNQCGAKLEDGRAPKDADGRAKLYADIAHPINSDCREMIQRRVIHDFMDELELAKLPGYVSRYDDFEFEYEGAMRARPVRYDQPHAQSAPASSRLPTPVQDKPTERVAQQRGRTPDRPPEPHTPESEKGSGFGAGIFPES